MATTPTSMAGEKKVTQGDALARVVEESGKPATTIREKVLEHKLQQLRQQLEKRDKAIAELQRANSVLATNNEEGLIQRLAKQQQILDGLTDDLVEVKKKNMELAQMVAEASARLEILTQHVAQNPDKLVKDVDFLSLLSPLS